jgi:hypothetical protein
MLVLRPLHEYVYKYDTYMMWRDIVIVLQVVTEWKVLAVTLEGNLQIILQTKSKSKIT